VLQPRRGERLDFVVSGRSLYAELVGRGYDIIPRTGSGLLPIDVDTRDLLLKESGGDTPSGRVALYICPECGDLGCGAVSVKIMRGDTTITWCELGWGNDHAGQLERFDRLGPFQFDYAEYRQALVDAAIPHPKVKLVLACNCKIRLPNDMISADAAQSLPVSINTSASKFFSRSNDGSLTLTAVIEMGSKRIRLPFAGICRQSNDGIAETFVAIGHAGLGSRARDLLTC